MSFERWMIAPFDQGLRQDLKPFMIPDEAFASLNNAYIFRGRVKKRVGSSLTGTGATNSSMASLYSRLAINLGTTNGSGVKSGTVPGGKWKIGQMFSVGNVIFTVTTAGAATMLRTDGSVETATYNTTNGAYAITIAALPNTAVFFYPAEPVMGLMQYDSGSIYNAPTWAFDTQFAYHYTGNYWVQAGEAIWHGTNINYFWACNWTGITREKTNLFVSNFHVTNLNGSVVGATDDPIWTYDSTVASPPGPQWTTFQPKFLVAGAGNYVATARIIIGFKNRLLLLNTVETDAAGTTNIHYPNRCRFCHNGSPFPAATAWLEPNQVGADGAGWIDAPTQEQIVSAGLLKDRLIVYFERSTWELAYTGNQVLPFVWQQINSELGSDAPFSSVLFDKVVLTIGNTGIHASNGSNVERIDNPIPDQIFKIRDKNNGTARVNGVRDYFTEMVYWTFPEGSETTTQEYPNKVLVFNYRNKTWAYNDDCITVFGYFEQQTDNTWAVNNDKWSDAGYTWASALRQANFRQVLGGNQQGYVFIVDPSEPRNAPVMAITQMTYDAPSGLVTITSLDHTLAQGDYVYIENISSVALPGASGTTDITGAAAGTVPGAVYALGQSFVIGPETCTVISNIPGPQPMRSTGGSTTHTYNISNGAYNFVGAAPNTQIYYFPCNLSGIQPVWDTPTSDTFRIFTNEDPGAYLGGATLARVSQIYIESKQWNPYLEKDYAFHLAKIDFNVDRTPSGEVTIDYAPSYSNVSMLSAGQATNMRLGTGILETRPMLNVPLESLQDQFWHAVFFQADGDSIQIRITMAINQMMDPAIALSDFELNAMILYTRKTSTRL
jgi:hypothetical protein